MLSAHVQENEILKVHCENSYKELLRWGSAMAQAISNRRPGFASGSVYARFVVDKVVGQVFSDFFVPCRQYKSS